MGWEQIAEPPCGLVYDFWTKDRWGRVRAVTGVVLGGDAVAVGAGKAASIPNLAYGALSVAA